MNEYLSNDAIDNLSMLVISAAFLLIFWILETAWRNDKRWIMPIFILPPLLLVFICKYWEETKAKCFFCGLFVIILVMLGAVTGYNFIYRVGSLFGHIAIWPYYLYGFIKPYVAWLP